MLFDVKQFEQVFKDQALKKGLRLFEKGALELAERLAGFGYHFSVESAELYLKKKGDKLLSYSCTCANTQYCEHLAAALFYFQQETLGISVKNIRAKKSDLKDKNILRNSSLKKKESESLLSFIKENRNKLTAAGIVAFLSGKSTVLLSDVYCAQIQLVLGPYLVLKKIDQNDTVALAYKIKECITAIAAEIKKERDWFYLKLGLVKAYMPLFHLRFSGEEKFIFEPYHKALESLDASFTKGLSAGEKAEWFSASLASVESNKNLQSGAFLFLIPRFVSSTKKEEEFLALSLLLKKRVLKTPYSQQLDKLQIARLEVAYKEHELFGTAFPAGLRDNKVELLIAKAELCFCGRHFKRAFELLESGYEEIRTVHKNYYGDYLSYVIKNARKHHNTELEIKYLREEFIHRLFILPEALERFLELIPEKERTAALHELINQIKKNARGYYLDKLSLLLLRANLLDELTRELASQHAKFGLMHEVALKKHPGYTPAFLQLYMRHLAETLKQDSIYNYQVELFTTAKVFLDRLPEKTVMELIKKLLDQIGKTGYLYRYINEMYDYPFLREEHNY